MGVLGGVLNIDNGYQAGYCQEAEDEAIEQIEVRIMLGHGHRIMNEQD